MASIRSQAIANFLGKTFPQYYFTPQDVYTQEPTIRVRNQTHRVVQASPEERDEKVYRRCKHMNQGVLTPMNETYVPVGGWPTLGLEELVFDAMRHCVDPKIRDLYISHFEKFVPKRTEQARTTEIFKDTTDLFSCSTAGFSAIRTHLNETESRIQSVKAGVDFTSHFMRVWNERLRREEPPQKEEISKIDIGDPDLVNRKERVRRDDILFLATLKLLIEKLLHVKVRHLRSNVPINLDNLDSPASGKDTDLFPAPSRKGLGGHGGVLHSFREQILSQVPVDSRRRKGDGLVNVSSQMLRKLLSPRLHHVRGEPSPGETPGHVPTPLDEKYIEMLRKPWPIVWQALAAAEQGHTVGTPLPNPPVLAKQKNSLTNILVSRKDWATTRKELNQAVDETLWRVDNETIESFQAQMDTLSNLSVSTFFKAHQRLMEAEVKRKRRQRQSHTIYDCELSAWYKELVQEVQKENGKKDVEINNLLETIKPYFKLSPTNPKFSKAKMALIVMSLPVMQICQIYYQRAVTFLLDHVFKAPPGTLGHWLKIRGLPVVLP